MPIDWIKRDDMSSSSYFYVLYKNSKIHLKNLKIYHIDDTLIYFRTKFVIKKKYY